MAGKCYRDQLGAIYRVSVRNLAVLTPAAPPAVHDMSVKVSRIGPNPARADPQQWLRWQGRQTDRREQVGDAHGSDQYEDLDQLQSARPYALIR